MNQIPTVTAAQFAELKSSIEFWNKYIAKSEEMEEANGSLEVSIQTVLLDDELESPDFTAFEVLLENDLTSARFDRFADEVGDHVGNDIAHICDGMEYFHEFVGRKDRSWGLFRVANADM
jgi:hypothetical protein